MEKIQCSDLKEKRLIYESEYSSIYRLSDGSILKIFKEVTQIVYLIMGISLERKILSSGPIERVPEIVVPKKAVYNKDAFYGYITDYVEGIDYNVWDDRLTLQDRTNLTMYADMHRKLEDIIRRANGQKIIMPDLLTCDNIIITPQGEMKIIDYDGLQVGKYKAVAMSTSLGDQRQYEMPKYCNNMLFTHNLDKKSLIILYFLQTFNVNLEMIGKINPATGKVLTLDDIFNELGLDDDDIKQKVWKCYQKECPNEFLGDDVYRIADKYKMFVRPLTHNNQKLFIKRLYRK